jgi:hypothetical protein
MYLGFNYDLARGIQDELLRWAELERKAKSVKAARSEDFLIGSKPQPTRSAPEETVEDRRAS